MLNVGFRGEDLRVFCVTCVLLFGFAVVPGWGKDVTLLNLWPVLDYRADPETEYRSLHLFGPLIKQTSTRSEAVGAFRPLFYNWNDRAGASRLDVLSPLWTSQRTPDSSRFNLIHLLSGDFGSYESGSRNRFHLFPFLFYGSGAEDTDDYFGFFPVGGTIRGWFGRDAIHFALFPLYSQTWRAGRRTDNLFWPIFARISGEQERGYKFWPLYGQSYKSGVYSKRFFLWPVFFLEKTGLDTDNPTQKRAVWPLYIDIDSAKESFRSVLWPFFSRRQGYQEDFTEWTLLWPLVRFTSGETRHGVRLLPLYADETVAAHHNRWFGWPIYKIEETRTELFERRRHRVLFFLYSDMMETQLVTGAVKRRIDFWPLFGYSRKQGVSHLHLLSLLEPFFPDHHGIESSWAPLWRVYQQKWDDRGNRVISLLWNLYWQEKRGHSLAWELFPLISYQRDESGGRDISFLKGLLRYHAGPTNRSLRLFYLPWGLPVGKQVDRPGEG